MRILQVIIFSLRYIFCAGSGMLLFLGVRRFLPAGKGMLRRVIPFVLFVITADNKSWIGDENPLILFPFFIAMFLLCYGGPWHARLVTGVIFYVLVEPLFMVVDTPDLDLLHSIPYETITSGIKLLLCALLWLLIRRIAPKEGTLHLSGRLWALLGALALAPLFSVLSFSLWDSGTFDYDTYYFIVRRLAFTVLPFVFLSALALLVAMVVLARHEELEEAKRLSEVQAVYYQSLQREQIGVRTLKHDLHNHIAAAQSLLEQGNPGEAGQYLASLSNAPELAASVRICENDIANAILGDKAAAMQREGMTADWEVALPQQLSLPDIELCALFGNALDNAMEAARGAEDKTIVLRARADKGVLMLRVKNAHGQPPQKRNGAFKTTKADKQAHGFGLAGMREIVQRHGGSLEANAENGHFELVIVLPLA